MIRTTLPATQLATFSVLLPNHAQHGLPTPQGTGFFVAPDGWFITAAHVITEDSTSDGPVRSDVGRCLLRKEHRIGSGVPGAGCNDVSVEHVLPKLDLAILKVDFTANRTKAWLAGRTEFPHLKVSVRDLDEGEAVYSFGYPLSSAWAATAAGGGSVIGTRSLCPRVTSAIVSSTLETTRMITTDLDPKTYVLDRALNYGNSGGPIVSVETGRVHALCSHFQPVFVPQPHLLDSSGSPLQIMVPSLYGVVSSLANASLIDLLGDLGVPITSD